MTANRSAGRNVHIFDSRDRETAIGGLVLTAGVTNANFFAMIEIFVIFQGSYTLQNESGIIVDRNDFPLLAGNYYIVSSTPIQLSNEIILTRTISLQSGSRVDAFRDAVRLRDRKCVITGRKYVDNDDWWGLEAAHIFPLSHLHHWNEHDYGRWIPSPPPPEKIKGGKINSVQNGLLLRNDIHQGFDFYKLSINPDDNYKVVFFSDDRDDIAGKHLDERLLNDPERPADQLLRWHFRQAVLVNMRGAGEPTFEHDFPPGSDIMGDILNGPKPEARMEAELFGRLAVHFDITE